MMTSFRDYSDLPLTLSVEQVGNILGIGRVKAYELANSEGFPVLRLGRRMIIPKTSLISWIEKNSKTSKNNN